MSELAIRAAGLGKRYRIGTAAQRHDHIRDAVVHALKAPLRNLNRLRRLSRFRDAEADAPDVVWALRDASFEVRAGEVLGIVGRNGAGKSTLLKVLSRITRPTTGHAEVFGRVGSLLEVGTGFHPELTGRENIYLNGSILGMDRAHISRKFDEIVAFSGVEKFIDTPVKRYSSGMYLRLAFAVAAHLEPEVLIVDEVLAVGDATFQKKCLGKMEDVAGEGRTVLLVSHNMAAVQGLCTRAILLEQGRVTAEGPSGEVVERYFRGTEDGSLSDGAVDLRNHSGRRPGSASALTQMRLRCDGQDTTAFRMGGPLRVEVSYDWGPIDPVNTLFCVIVEDALGQRLVTFPTLVQAPELVHETEHRATIAFEVPEVRLLPGLYYLTVILATGPAASPTHTDLIERAVRISVEPADVFGTGVAPEAGRYGLYYQEASWSLSPTSDPEFASRTFRKAD